MSTTWLYPTAKAEAQGWGWMFATSQERWKSGR
jgi:hypothetical protein